MRNIIALTFAMLIVLSGCGGSSSQNGGVTDPAALVPDPEERLQELNENALLLLSDMYIYARASGISDDFVADSTCSFSGCRLTERVTGYSEFFTIDDLLNNQSPASAYRFSRSGSQNGIDLFRASAKLSTQEGTVDAEGYGAWMEHSVFVAVRGDGTLEGVFLEVGIGEVIGNASRSVPAVEATYGGAMLGYIRRGSSRGRHVRGDAQVDFTLLQLGRPRVNVLFSNITGASVRDMSWGSIPVASNGTFRSGGIEGSFFGGSHEEVAGTFHAFDIVGAYGAKK